jgi:hypothetical protein
VGSWKKKKFNNISSLFPSLSLFFFRSYLFLFLLFNIINIINTINVIIIIIINLNIIIIIIINIINNIKNTNKNSSYINKKLRILN